MNFSSYQKSVPKAKSFKANPFATSARRPLRKRRKLVEEFESLSLEEETEEIPTKFSSTINSNYLNSDSIDFQFKS